MPKSVANVRHLGPLHPRVCAIMRWDITACTTPERAKPRIKGHRISHNILKDINNACPILCTICIELLSLTYVSCTHTRGVWVIHKLYVVMSRAANWHPLIMLLAGL